MLLLCFTVFTCLSCEDMLVSFLRAGPRLSFREYTNLRMCLLKVATPLIKCGGGR